MNKHLLIFPVLLMAACSETSSSCSDQDQTCLLQAMKSHVTRTEVYWQPYFLKPVDARVYVAPKEVIEYIDLDNRRNGFDNIPSAPVLSDDFLQDVKAALSEIPVAVKSLLKEKLAGVYLIENLGGTGFTDYIFDEKGNTVAGFVVLDVAVLDKLSANKWASWKESTPFKKDPRYEIEAVIESDKTDTRKQAIQYILLHELGHVISINASFHPPWTEMPTQADIREGYDFFHESWLLDNKHNRYSSKFDSLVFPDRREVVYYFGAKLKGAQMRSIYSQLEQSNFVSLYAATGPGDDWAESFVTYVHSVLMKKPFSINIKEEGRRVKTFALCWGTPRCAGKEAILATLLGKNISVE